MVSLDRSSLRGHVPASGPVWQKQSMCIQITGSLPAERWGNRHKAQSVFAKITEASKAPSPTLAHCPLQGWHFPGKARNSGKARVAV